MGIVKLNPDFDGYVNVASAPQTWLNMLDLAGGKTLSTGATAMQVTSRMTCLHPL